MLQTVAGAGLVAVVGTLVGCSAQATDRDGRGSAHNDVGSNEADSVVDGGWLSPPEPEQEALPVDSEPDVAPDVSKPAPDRSPPQPLPANFRWYGYGIGASGAQQCDFSHLVVHATLPCLGADIDGEFFVREVLGVCESGPQEVQVGCVHSGTPPSDIDLSASPVQVDLATLRLEAPVSTTTLRALAADVCARDSKTLGDWYMLYDGDSALGRQLSFLCAESAGERRELQLANFEAQGEQGFADNLPGLEDWLAVLQSPRGSSERALHLSAEAGEDLELALHYHGLSPLASGLAALAFWARSESGQLTLRVEHAAWSGATGESVLPAPATRVSVNEVWQRFEIPFEELLASAAETLPFNATSGTESTVVRFVAEGTGPFDFWLDDVSYLCGSGDCRLP
jgi:hypothetical protein